MVIARGPACPLDSHGGEQGGPISQSINYSYVKSKLVVTQQLLSQALACSARLRICSVRCCFSRARLRIAHRSAGSKSSLACRCLACHLAEAAGRLVFGWPGTEGCSPRRQQPAAGLAETGGCREQTVYPSSCAGQRLHCRFLARVDSQAWTHHSVPRQLHNSRLCDTEADGQRLLVVGSLLGHP